MRRWASTLILGAAVATVVSGCAGPITQVGSVSREDVRAEQQEQLRLAADLAYANQLRVDRLAAPLLRAAAPLCGKAVAKRSKSDRREPGLVAPANEACPYKVAVRHGADLNASATGSAIYVETALLRFASDEELSVILAHEIAHNAMRHRDAQVRNMLGGALLGAIVDAAIDARGGYSGGRMTKAGAEAGAQAFSQDFEREADYVGLYILAWAGRPIGNAASFWRRMAVEHPSGIVFASTHPTTAERYVRLEQWNREIAGKLASGDAFGPEVKDPRLRVASRPSAAPQRSVSGGDVVLATIPANRPTPLGVDAGPKTSLAPLSSTVTSTPAATTGTTPSRPPADALAATAAGEDRFARATIGAPRSEAERAAAVPAYERGMAFLGAHQWGLAKAQFRLFSRSSG